jgi:hypothetical protein
MNRWRTPNSISLWDKQTLEKSPRLRVKRKRKRKCLCGVNSQFASAVVALAFSPLYVLFTVYILFLSVCINSIAAFKYIHDVVSFKLK